MSDVAAIPDDIISENILVRLPVKSLLRFLCVCKKWGSLISSPRFIRKHLNRSDPYNHRRLLLDSEPCQSVDLAAGYAITTLGKPFGWNNEFLGCCHGLICASCTDPQVVSSDIRIYNPATRKVRTLPVPEGGFTRRDLFISGFGCDLSEDNYKIVRGIIMPNLIQPKTIELFVFNLKTDSWKISTVDGSWCIINDNRKGAWINGHLHWLVRNRCILALDLALEAFVEISFPVLEGNHRIIFLGVLVGCLYLLIRRPGVAYEFWVMKEYGVPSSWEKLTTMPLVLEDGTDIGENLGDSNTLGGHQVLRFLGNRFMVFEDDDYGLLVYDTEDNTTSTIAIDTKLVWGKCVLYTESLVPPMGL